MIVKISGEKNYTQANFYKPVYIGWSRGHLCDSTAFLFFFVLLFLSLPITYAA